MRVFNNQLLKLLKMVGEDKRSSFRDPSQPFFHEQPQVRGRWHGIISIGV